MPCGVATWKRSLTPFLCQYEVLEAVIKDPKINPSKFDEVLHLFTSQKMEEIYAEAAGDYRKVPTYKQLQKLFAGRAERAMLNAHHTAVKSWARILLKDLPAYQGYTEAQWAALLDDMPAILLNRIKHLDLGEGSSGFHRILNGTLPPGTTGRSAILDGLERAYSDWDEVEGPKIWAVARGWLRAKGIE
jgi:hypothetical protein